jgi:hypothetical protein
MYLSRYEGNNPPGEPGYEATSTQVETLLSLENLCAVFLQWVFDRVRSYVWSSWMLSYERLWLLDFLSPKELLSCRLYFLELEYSD